MISIFSDLVEQYIEIFMDGFSGFRASFYDCLINLSKMLKRCREKNLTLNWKKCHFMVTHGIVLGHVISHDGIAVDIAKTDFKVNLTPPTSVKVIRSFRGHVDFYCHFIKDFNKIAKPLTNLLAKNVTFHFSEECHVAFINLKESLTSALVLHPHIDKCCICMD